MNQKSSIWFYLYKFSVLKGVFLTRWHHITIHMRITGSKLWSAAHAEEIWNHSAILDKELNFSQIPEPRSLRHKTRRICLYLSSCAFLQYWLTILTDCLRGFKSVVERGRMFEDGGSCFFVSIVFSVWFFFSLKNFTYDLLPSNKIPTGLIFYYLKTFFITGVFFPLIVWLSFLLSWNLSFFCMCTQRQALLIYYFSIHLPCPSFLHLRIVCHNAAASQRTEALVSLRQLSASIVFAQ